MTQVIAKMLPILLLLGLGLGLRKKALVSQSAVGELKKLVINLFLPAVLFVTFVEMELESQYFMIFIATFILLVLFYYIGVALNKVKKLYHPMLPFVLTATTFGLLGLSLYETAFGADKLVKMSILGVGHELFIWFVYITIMKIRLSNEKVSLGIIKNFATSPLIIAVVSGIMINALGWSIYFETNFILAGILTTFKYLASLATPLILMIVGYGLVLKKQYMVKSMKLLLLRWIVMIGFGYAFKFIVLNPIMGNDPYFDYAFFTFVILPPPMSLPIFTAKYSTKENAELMNNTVVLGTLVCIVAFIAFNFFV